MQKNFATLCAPKLETQQSEPEYLSSKRPLRTQRQRTVHKYVRGTQKKFSKNSTQNNNVEKNQEQIQERTIYQNVNTVRKVARFLQILKSRVIRQRKTESISDKEYFYLENSNNQQDGKQWLFAWDNSLINWLEICFMVVLIIGIWSYTYEIVFGFAFKDLNAVRTAALFVNYFLIIFVYLTSQVKNERLEVLTKRKLIFFLYLKSYLLFDALFIIGVMTSFFEVDGLFIVSRVLTLAAVPTISRIIKKAQDKYAVSAEIESFFGILKFVFIILAFLHFLSLSLNLLSILQRRNGQLNTWQQMNGIQNQTDLQKYIDGYYWSMTILSTVGFGDFAPANTTQRGVITLVMIVGSLFFGYTINVVGNLIGVLRQSKAQNESQRRRLNNYLERTRAPNNVKDKIKEYFYNQRQIKETYDQKTQNFFLDKMTKQLRNEVKLKNNLQVVQNSKYLKLFTRQTQKKIAVALQKMVYAPDQTVFNQDTDQIKLYLIEQGVFEQFCYDLPKNNLQNGKKKISTYDKSDNTVGWSNLITGYKYSSCIKSNDYTMVYQLPQQQFLQLIKENPQDFIKYSQMREKILQKKIQLKKDCFVCDRLTHNVVQCPQIHFIPRPLQIMISFYKNELKILKNKRDIAYFRRNKREKVNINFMTNVISSINSMRSSNQIQDYIPKVNQIAQSILKVVDKRNSNVGLNQVEKIVNSIFKWQQSQKQGSGILKQPKQRNKSYKMDAIAQEIQNMNTTKSGKQLKSRFNMDIIAQQSQKQDTIIQTPRKDRKSMYKKNSIVTKELVQKLDVEQDKSYQLNQSGQFEYVMLVKQVNFFPSYCLQQVVKQMDQDNKIMQAMKFLKKQPKQKSRFSNFFTLKMN